VRLRCYSYVSCHLQRVVKILDLAKRASKALRGRKGLQDPEGPSGPQGPLVQQEVAVRLSASSKLAARHPHAQ
jgi:hypothetical protein